jgi:ribosome-associated toxin RatA of RatAB toxin-antitoxin module
VFGSRETTMFGSTAGISVNAGGRAITRRLCATVTAIVLVAAVPVIAAGSEPSVTVDELEGVYSVRATFTVPHAPSFAVAALTDYAQIPRFMPAVRTSHVLEQINNRAVVEQEAVARFMMFSKRVHLVLEVQQGGGTIRFRDRCGKSFARYEGLWTITEREGATHVIYELSAQPSFDVPEFLLKRLLRRDASDMIERLRAEIAARAHRAVR